MVWPSLPSFMHMFINPYMLSVFNFIVYLYSKCISNIFVRAFFHSNVYYFFSVFVLCSFVCLFFHSFVCLSTPPFDLLSERPIIYTSKSFFADTLFFACKFYSFSRNRLICFGQIQCNVFALTRKRSPWLALHSQHRMYLQIYYIM